MNIKEIREAARKILTERLLKEEEGLSGKGLGVVELEKVIRPIVVRGGSLHREYTSMTSEEQRSAYRHTFLNNILNILKMSPESLKGFQGDIDLAKQKNDLEAFDAIQSLNEAEDATMTMDIEDPRDYTFNPEAEDLEELSQEEEESILDDEEFNGLSDEEKTAVQAANKMSSSLEKQINKALENLFGEDERIFSKYLVINLSLYLDKFEEEIDGYASGEETSNEEIDTLKSEEGF